MNTLEAICYVSVFGLSALFGFTLLMGRAQRGARQDRLRKAARRSLERLAQ